MTRLTKKSDWQTVIKPRGCFNCPEKVSTLEKVSDYRKLLIAPRCSKIVDHFFIFQKNSLHLKMANFSSLKRRSIFTSRKILREKLELHSASKKSLNIAKMVEKRFELPTSTHDLAYEKSDWQTVIKPLFFLTRAKILTRA